jgi:hypothetical protein
MNDRIRSHCGGRSIIAPHAPILPIQRGCILLETKSNSLHPHSVPLLAAAL